MEEGGQVVVCKAGTNGAVCVRHVIYNNISDVVNRRLRGESFRRRRDIERESGREGATNGGRARP